MGPCQIRQDPTDPVVLKKATDAITPCLNRAFTALHYAKASDAYGHVQDMWETTLLRLHDDPRMKPVDAAWNQCMKSAGYAYPTPIAAAQDRTLLGRGLPVPAGAQLPPPSPIEKAAALADVRCKQRVGYLPAFATTASAIEKQLIAGDGPGLRQVLSEWNEVLEQARGTA